MKISDYSFGNITINGETYTKDVIIYPDRIFSLWWRKVKLFLLCVSLRQFEIRTSKLDICRII